MSTGGLTALRKLTKHLKLLKEACFTGDTKVLTEAQKLIQIKTERAEIKVTPSHQMLKVGNTWVFAGALKVGDKLAGYDGEEVEITEIEEELLESPEKVYNLTIEDFHTYVVSEESVVVHNKCDLPGLKVAVKLSDEVIEHSVSNQSRLQHAYKHASDLGFGNWNKENSLLWKDYIIDTLKNTTSTFDNTLGRDPVKGFYRVVDGNDVAVYIYKEGANKGLVASVVKLTENQLTKFGLK